MIDDMEVTDFLEVVILCLSLLIVIPILMIIWIDCDRIEKKKKQMEIKNGIIIDGVLHEAVQYKINCKRCSLLSVCYEFNAVCAVIGCEAFVERGKVTVTSYYRETPKNAGEIIKNR